MAIIFHCVYCAELHRVKDELAGKLAKCKNAACRKQVMIPLKSTVGVNGAGRGQPLDAEALAAAALAEDAAAVVKEEPAAVKNISVNCSSCDFKFEVDTAMQGKNTRCPDCGNVFRVKKVIEDKPADWRQANTNRPSLAKSAEPVPEGVWETQRKGVSGESLVKAGAVDLADEEDDEDPFDRRIRRIKKVFYAVAFVSIVAFAVMYFVRERREGKQEKFMDQALKEVNDGVKNSKEQVAGTNRIELRAAINRFAGEYHLRAATQREDIDKALKNFKDARGQLQNIKPESSVDRNAMLLELALAQAALGGDLEEVNKDRRMLWTDVQKELRQTVQAISQRETEMRMRTIRLLTRKLAEKDQGLLAYEISKACSNESEKAEFAGRVGIELFLAGKREQAEQVLNKASTESPQSAAPALTALWLALNPDQNAPPATFPRVKPPEKGSSLTRDARLAYSEGKALQGKIVEGKQMAESPPESPIVFVMEADILVARVALETGKAAEAIPIVDSLARLVKENFKPEQTEKQPDWQLYQLVELAMKANRPDVAATVLDLMKEKTVASWARLEALRIKLASQPKEKGDETYLAAIGAPEDISLAAAISQEALARHNEAAGKTYRKAIEELPKVTVRPFAYAGLALGGQDRAGK